MSVRWHIVTPELPPDCGGVGDYSAQVAEALARNGDRVSVYYPAGPIPWKPTEDLEVVQRCDRAQTTVCGYNDGSRGGAAERADGCAGDT